MSIIRNSFATKAVSAVVGIMMVVASFAAILPLVADAQTVGHTNPTGTVFARNLSVGSTGADVMALQKVLNTNAATMVAASGAGSLGMESSYFGLRTKAAVIAYQNMYASSILAPIHLTAGTGFVGAATRASLNALGTVGNPNPTPTPLPGPTPTPTGGSVSVSAGAAIANGVAPFSAARVPFTNVVVTAGSQDVTLSGVLVERTGPSVDANIAGVLLLDEQGLQIGIARTLNASHQATIGATTVIKAGTSRTFTVAANIAASGTATAGQVVSFTVKGLSTTASVSGSLPITGAMHTITNLTIGSVTMARGAFDPGAAATKEVGTIGYNFSSVKVTAGSSEDVWIRSVRFNQIGSAGPGDFSNLSVVVDGVSYPVIVSTDGKYYSAIFPGSGLQILKGASKDITIKGDVSGGSNRTIEFDIAKRTDLYVVGGTYGYGITPPYGSNTCATGDTSRSKFCTTEDPWYQGSIVTVSTGTMNVSAWTGVAASNVSVDTALQPLAGFTVEVKGEPISVNSMGYSFVITDADSGGEPGLGDITGITLVNGDTGAVLAGPIDGSGATSLTGSATTTDTVTFPVGVTHIVVKAKLNSSSGFEAGDTVKVTTNPGTGWTTVTGQNTGNTVTPTPSSYIGTVTQTVRAGSLAISVSSQPAAQTVIAGASQFTFANYIFNASQSGDDVRMNTIPLYFGTNGTRTDLKNCYLYDGTNVVTEVKNPATTDTASSTTFTFTGSGVVFAKGTTKTLSLKCDIVTGVTTKYWWGIDDAQTYTASLVTSGTAITPTATDSSGQTMTAAASGNYQVTNDTSVTYKVAQAGSTNVLLGAFKVEASSTEDLMLKQIALQLGNTASNSPADLAGQGVTLWANGVQIGTAQFGVGSSGDNATSTPLNSGAGLLIAKGTVTTIQVRGDLSSQDASNGTPGAFLVVNYDGDNNGLNGNYATGKDSGSTISGTSGDISTTGLRIFRTVPTVADVTTSTVLAAGSDLYAIQITAGSGRDLGLRALTFNVATTGATVTGFQLFGPNGAVNASAVNPIDGADSDTAVDTLHLVFDNTAVDRIIEAGTSKTYRLRANTVSGLTSQNTETLNVYLQADSAYPTPSGSTGLVFSVAQIEGSASTSDNFIWTPFSTTTPQATAGINSNADWTNGYGVAGYPAVGQSFSARVFKD